MLRSVFWELVDSAVGHPSCPLSPQFEIAADLPIGESDDHNSAQTQHALDDTGIVEASEIVDHMPMFCATLNELEEMIAALPDVALMVLAVMHPLAAKELDWRRHVQVV